MPPSVARSDIDLPHDRICVGRHMANNSIFINIATILWAANIAAPKDGGGEPIVPDTLETVNAGLVVLALIHQLVPPWEMTPFSYF